MPWAVKDYPINTKQSQTFAMGKKLSFWQGWNNIGHALPSLNRHSWASKFLWVKARKKRMHIKQNGHQNGHTDWRYVLASFFSKELHHKPFKNSSFEPPSSNSSFSSPPKKRSAPNPPSLRGWHHGGRQGGDQRAEENHSKDQGEDVEEPLQPQQRFRWPTAGPGGCLGGWGWSLKQRKTVLGSNGKQGCME